MDVIPLSGVKFTAITEVRTSVEHHAARACPDLSGITWAQWLERAFRIVMPKGILTRRFSRGKPPPQQHYSSEEASENPRE